MGESRPWGENRRVDGMQVSPSRGEIRGSLARLREATAGMPGGVSGTLPGANGQSSDIDEIDLLRAGEYGLISALLREAPDRAMLDRLATLEGDGTALGAAHSRLAAAAASSDPEALEREFFSLFIGLGRGELSPYASYYLTGFLNERPLARVRQDLASMGIESVETLHEPEDHIAILCEVMAGLAGRHFGGTAEMERTFFERHLRPWGERFFADLEAAKAAHFYRPVGTLGRLFMGIEADAFAMAGELARSSAG